MTDPVRVIARSALEVVGVAVFVLSHFMIALIYVLGSSLRGMPGGVYWSVVGLGYAAMVALPALGDRAFGAVRGRRRFDAWLAAFPVAIGATLLLMVIRLPLRFGGWDAHGMGASGAEANAVFLPWLHAAIWVGIARLWSRGLYPIGRDIPAD